MSSESLLSLFFLPPAGPLLLIALGLLLRRRRPRAGTALTGIGLASAWLLSTPWVGDNLLAARQTHPALHTPPDDVQAIVVLTAGRLHRAAEYGGDDQPDRLTLERLRHAAWWHHRTGLPVLVTGGRLEEDDQGSLAEIAARTLQDDWGVTPVWQEPRARTTWENARYSAQMLRHRGIERVLLVTHAWHMPRAMYAFRRTGLTPIAAPTAFVQPAEGQWQDFLPRSHAQRHSHWALHEWLGLWWYRLK